MRHRDRIYIAGAIAASALTAGLVPAAWAKKPSKPSTPSGTAVSCKVLVTTEVPSNQTVVLPSAAKGRQWGAVRCDGPLGPGAAQMAFKSPDSGDLVGTFASWFGTGAMHGKYKLTQQQGSLTTANQFAFAAYSGKLTVTGGTGVLAGASGTGTATCTSQDGLHFKCRERLSLTTK